jgi:hypothetical protein
MVGVVASVAMAETLETRGVVDAVTVYRGQALVTRTIQVPGAAGLREVVVTDLPPNVVPGSIYAESADGAEVRSVSFRLRPVAGDVREEVRKLDLQIRDVQDQLAAIARRKGLLGEQKAYLDKLEQFVAPAATAELTHGVLNAETLKSLTLFSGEQRRALAEDELKSAIEERALKEQLDVLQRERQTLTSSSNKSQREAIVFLNLTAPDGKVRLRYLVDQATWSPSYSVRTDGTADRVLIEYYASIQQMSGEDWTDVAMTLSTATPALVSKAPALTPLAVALAPMDVPAQAAGGKLPAMSRDEVYSRKQQLESDRNRLGNIGIQQQMAQQSAAVPPAVDFDRALNEAACDLQMLDLIGRGKIVRITEEHRRGDQESLSVTYQLAARTSLPSRQDQQLVQIAALPLTGEFYKVAIPVLTSYVYDEASLVNDSKLVLLAGPTSTYVAGQFVGSGEIPTVTAGESFTVGLGIDSSLRAARELIDRSESIQGGNRTVEYTYRLTLENFGTAPVHVRLIDRLPSARASEVKVTPLSSSAGEEDSDPTYQTTERKKGMLRWSVEVPPQTVGAHAKAFDYKFRVEYDKGMMITGMPVAMK